MRHVRTRTITHVVDPTTGHRWPIPAGGSDDDQNGDTAADGDEPPADANTDSEPPADDLDADADKALGDAGKKAIDRMKAERNAAKSEAAEAKKQLAELQQANETETDKRIREATEQALAGANARVVSAEVRAQAAGKLADPADAIKFLDLNKFEVDDTGAVDQDAISAAIDELVKSKPYLAPQRRDGFQGTADGGARKDASKPSQLTADDVKRMSPEQIEEARVAGRLETYLSTPG